MFLPGYLAAKALEEIEPEQLQPAGVDLRVGNVLKLRGPGFLGKKRRELPPAEPVEPERGAWRLEPGVYKIVFQDPVYVPSSAVGLCFPRSSLLRSGVQLSCTVWDPGYYGRGEAMLAVLNPNGFVLEQGARVAQMVFMPLLAPGDVYKGVYLGENLDKV